jgi:hypothetical protein
MVNIEQITSTLAKLPDQALQRYATMHKDDPYIMSLAVSESKRRKEMRAAGQSQSGQPQPKVVDQAISDMAPPEQQGIGSLPAAAQMNFADGGITGYADGGDVERYQFGGRTQPNSLSGDIPGFVAGTGNAIPQQGAPEEVPFFRRLFREAQETGRNYSLEQAKARIAGGYGTNSDKEIVAAASQASAPTPAPAQDMAQFDAASNAYMAERAAKQQQGLGGSAPAPLAPAPSAMSPKAAPALSIEDRFLAAQKKMGDQPNPFSTQEAELQTEANKMAQERLAGVKASQEQFKDVYKGRESRIEERAKELEKSKDTNTGLAFLEAGLAIMSTPGGLAAAVGKGAREGTAKYAMGIDKLRSAQDNLNEAKDRIEDLKLNRAEMSAKELRDAELGIQQAVLTGKKDALASSKALYGDRSKLSQTIVAAELEQENAAKDRLSRERTAGAAAAIGRQSEDKFIADWLKKPENAGKSFSDAYNAFKSTGTSAERNDITNLKAVRSALSKDLSDDLSLTPAQKVEKRNAIADIDRQMLALTGAPSQVGGPLSSGAGAPPPGAVRLKSAGG